jgi:hypothetical protein
MGRRKRTDNSETGEMGEADNLTVAAKKAIIRDAAQSIIRLKGERSAISESITEVRGRVKGLNIKMADFNAALRLYELEVADRDNALDSIRLCFEALDLGHQGEMFPDSAKIESAKKARGLGEGSVAH